MTSNSPTELDARESILFLGSGFSRLAKNILNRNLPTGRELKQELAAILRVDTESYDLKNLADEVNSRPNSNLYQTLYNLFTVRRLHPDQRSILALPWSRIYTTNYDDTVEFAFARRRTTSSFSYDDPKPRRLPAGSVIHLHGVIRKTTEENVLNQLVLNESSYARQHFETSPWYEDFIRDLRFCAACYFVGYSLTDYHIAALLMQDPSTPQKTYFVTGESPDEIYCNRVAPYGTVLPVGTAGFANLCRDLPAHDYSISPHSLRAFRYLDPFDDRGRWSRQPLWKFSIWSHTAHSTMSDA